MKIKSQIKRIVAVILCDMLLTGLIFNIFPISFSSASLLDELDSQITQTQKKIQDAEKRVGDYKKKISQAQKDIKSLKQQINLMEAEIEELLAQIDLTQAEIEQTNLEILKKISEIDKKISEINHKKEILAEIIRNIHDHDNKGELEILLSANNFSDLFNEMRYADVIQDQVQDMLKSLQSLKSLLEQQKQNLETKKQEQEKLKKRLTQEQITLQTRKESKKVLLLKTNNQEKQYQKLLAQIQEQKESLASDLNQLSQEKQEELARIRALQSKPGSGLASESWHFYQTDPRWKNKKIGISNLSLDDYGCAIASLSMIFKYYGIDTDPGQLSREPIFTSNGLIYWPKKRNSLELIFNGVRQPIDWQTLDKEIKNARPVIVRITLISGGKRKGHYVVIHGKDKNGEYVIHDPFYGPNEYLKSTRQSLEVVYGAKSFVEQMIIYH